jgi:dCMP deaminase
MDWDQYFISLTYLVAMKSKDRSTHVGSVIVGPDHEIRSTGYNSFPRRLNDDVPARHERPLKYIYTEHAERNAVYNAARIGVSCRNCILYTSACPCVDCARAIIQSGISEVVVHSENPLNRHDRWQTSFDVAMEMFDECGVRFGWWSGEPLALTGLADGRRYRLNRCWAKLAELPAQFD